MVLYSIRSTTIGRAQAGVSQDFFVSSGFAFVNADSTTEARPMQHATYNAEAPPAAQRGQQTAYLATDTIHRRCLLRAASAALGSAQPAHISTNAGLATPAMPAAASCTHSQVPTDD